MPHYNHPDTLCAEICCNGFLCEYVNNTRGPQADKRLNPKFVVLCTSCGFIHYRGESEEAAKKTISLYSLREDGRRIHCRESVVEE